MEPQIISPKKKGIVLIIIGFIAAILACAVFWSWDSSLVATNIDTSSWLVYHDSSGNIDIYYPPDWATSLIDGGKVFAIKSPSGQEIFMGWPSSVPEWSDVCLELEFNKKVTKCDDKIFSGVYTNSSDPGTLEVFDMIIKNIKVVGRG